MRKDDEDMKMKMMIFVCSPYRGEVEGNVKRARRCAKFITFCGYVSIVLHLFFPHFLNDVDAEERILGITLDVEQMKGCDKVWVYGSYISDGMAYELGHNWGNRPHDFQVTIEDALDNTLGAVSEDVKYVSISGAESTGGIIGEYARLRPNNNVSLNISNITVSSSILMSEKSNVDTGTFGIGGIIGTLRKEIICNVQSVKVVDTNIYSGYGVNGDVNDVGTSQGDLHAKIKTDLACTLKAKNLMVLGVNTYRKMTPMSHTVSFDFKLDFNHILSDTNDTWNEKEIGDKYFTVTYHILGKKNRRDNDLCTIYGQSVIVRAGESSCLKCA